MDKITKKYSEMNKVLQELTATVEMEIYGIGAFASFLLMGVAVYLYWLMFNGLLGVANLLDWANMSTPASSGEVWLCFLFGMFSASMWLFLTSYFPFFKYQIVRFVELLKERR